MPILDLQKRSRELGRIRLGQKGAKGQPQKLDRFRFTSNSRAILDRIAELYGGTVEDWTGGTQAFEVLSETTRVPIMVPPQPVTQWFEFWTRAGCQHRCDGYTNVLTDERCDPEDPAHIEATDKPTTRLNVVLRDVEGIGTWRVESHGWNAAVELPDVAEFLAAAGGYVNGWLSLEQRTSVAQTDKGPQTRHYMVPIIEIDVTPAQLMAGHGRVAAPSLSGGPVGETPALASSGPDYVALAEQASNRDELADVWRQAKAAGHLTEGLNTYLANLAAGMPPVVDTDRQGGGNTDEGAAGLPAPAPSSEEVDDVVHGEIVDDDIDPDAVWAEIVRLAAGRGLGRLPDLEDDVRTFLGGKTSSQASGEDLQAYLDDLKGRDMVAP